MDKRQNILIVDDEPDLIELYEEHLMDDSEAIDYHSFSDTKKAMAAVKSNLVFDVAILDLHMPGHDGVTIASELMLSSPNAKIIFVTGAVEIEDLEHFNEKSMLQDRYGAMIFIKPFDFDIFNLYVKSSLPKKEEAPLQGQGVG